MPLLASALLAPHFTAGELGAHLPEANATIQANLYRLAAWLETARGIIGAPLRVTSGFRPPEHNAAVGGTSSSDHLRGLAADVVPVGVSQFTARSRLRAAADTGTLPAWDQLIYYPVEGHIHVGLGAGERREERIKLFEGSGGVPLLTADTVARLRGFAATVADVARSPAGLAILAALALFFFLWTASNGKA